MWHSLVCITTADGMTHIGARLCLGSVMTKLIMGVSHGYHQKGDVVSYWMNKLHYWPSAWLNDQTDYLSSHFGRSDTILLNYIHW